MENNVSHDRIELKWTYYGTRCATIAITSGNVHLDVWLLDQSTSLPGELYWQVNWSGQHTSRWTFPLVMSLDTQVVTWQLWNASQWLITLTPGGIIYMSPLTCNLISLQVSIDSSWLLRLAGTLATRSPDTRTTPLRNATERWTITSASTPSSSPGPVNKLLNSILWNLVVRTCTAATQR